MKNLIAAALPLTLVLGCTQGAEYDELAGESSADDVIDGKADSAESGAYTYFAIRRDMRKCSAPLCGGFFLERLNRTTTVCHDGKSSAACYTPELDWSEANLSAAQQDKLIAAASKGAFAANGTHGLVRGRFAKKNLTTSSPSLGRFIVTEAWVSASDTMADGVFVKARNTGIVCITAPCPSVEEKGLNTSRSAMISDLDFAPAELAPEQIEGFLGELRTNPSGIIVAGDRYTVKVGGRKAKGRTATAAFSRLADGPACFVGGCSGQICSDQDGAISTCDFRPEYACYQAATCERQADGACGWTPTEELQACIDGATGPSGH
ncbi:MAG: hypothetical protein KIT31_25095 [Deltaproteobacteria bacterium]|nr:hypothetical protein [Deltaproteobacteria bacterium]